MVLLAIVYVTIDRYDEPSDEGMEHDVDHIRLILVSHGTYGRSFRAFSCSIKLKVLLVYHEL